MCVVDNKARNLEYSSVESFEDCTKKLRCIWLEGFFRNITPMILTAHCADVAWFLMMMTYDWSWNFHLKLSVQYTVVLLYNKYIYKLNVFDDKDECLLLPRPITRSNQPYHNNTAWQIIKWIISLLHSESPALLGKEILYCTSAVTISIASLLYSESPPLLGKVQYL